MDGDGCKVVGGALAGGGEAGFGASSTANIGTGGACLSTEAIASVIFHPFNKPIKQTVTLILQRKAIEEVKYIKYLGVMIDGTLTWKHHINKVKVTLSRLCGLFYKIRPYVNKNIIKMLYNSLVYPHLTYGAEVWTLSGKTLLNSILMIQKRFVRMMTFNDVRNENYEYPHSSPLFKQLGILKIHDIQKFLHFYLSLFTKLLKKVSQITFITGLL